MFLSQALPQAQATRTVRNRSESGRWRTAWLPELLRFSFGDRPLFCWDGRPESAVEVHLSPGSQRFLLAGRPRAVWKIQLLQDENAFAYV